MSGVPRTYSPGVSFYIVILVKIVGFICLMATLHLTIKQKTLIYSIFGTPYNIFVTHVDLNLDVQTRQINLLTIDYT